MVGNNDINAGFIGQSDRLKGCYTAIYCDNQVNSLLGSSKKAKEVMGWEPIVNFETLIKEMVEHDLEDAKREKHLKEHGFKTNGRS